MQIFQLLFFSFFSYQKTLYLCSRNFQKLRREIQAKIIDGYFVQRLFLLHFSLETIF
jgi:hypothetical protein